ncbi:MAG: hypothetical protein RR266_04385 [Bacilli bacterium]
MKKVMISLLCLISILLSCAYGFNQKVVDNDSMINFNNNENSIELHIGSSSTKKEDLLNGFNSLKDKYNISIIRTDYVIEDNEQLVQKAGIFSDDYFKSSSLDLYSGRFPVKENEIISTFDTGNSKQVGTIRDLFGDQKMIVKSMEEAFLNSGLTVNGEYTIEFKNLKDIDIVKTEISEITGVDESTLFDSSSGSSTSTGTAYLITLILIVVVGAIFTLTNIFYPITKLKEIGVMKLLGYSNHKIWSELNASILIIPVIFTAISICLQSFLIHHANVQYFLNLCIYQLAVTLIGIAISLIMLFIIRRLKVSQILKKFFNFKISLYSSYILKFLVFAGLVFAIPYMAQEVQRYMNEKSMEKTYEEQANYLTLANFDFIGNELQEYMSSGEDSLGLKLIAMFNELEKTADAQYITTFEVQPNAPETKEYYAKLGAFEKDEYIFSVVNENYLKRIDYQFDKPLDDYFSKDLAILVPMKYKSENIEDLVDSRVISIYFSDLIDKPEKWDELPISIQYYNDNNKKIFSEDLERANIDNGYISDPIFICQSNRYLNTKNSFLANYAITNPVRIFDSVKNRDSINNAIANNGLENNRLEFASMLNSGFAQQISISQSSTLVWFGIIILALLISVLASYYISLIILVSKKQMVLVSRLLGHSFSERYKNEIFYFISIYVFCLLELLVLSRNLVSILFYIILVLIDMLIIYGLVRRHDTRSLSTALKGEE